MGFQTNIQCDASKYRVGVDNRASDRESQYHTLFIASVGKHKTYIKTPETHMNVLIIAYKKVSLVSGYGAFNKVGGSNAPYCLVHNMNADFIRPKNTNWQCHKHAAKKEQIKNDSNELTRGGA